MNMKNYLFLYLLLSTYAVRAEILDVNVTWNGYQCMQNCPEALQQQFAKIRGVEAVKVNNAGGAANLTWKPEFPFSYRMIKAPMQMVGVGLNDIRVKVRGKVKEQGRQVVLTSEGDNTHFVLVSPIMPSKRMYTTLPNPYFRELAPALRDRIMRDAGDGKIMVIEGPLYRPARSPPLQIIVQSIKVEKQ